MSPRILIVDDEPSLVQGLSYALARDGYELMIEVDGEAAVETALSSDLDLIILDLMLPKLSGIEACRRIRAASDVPIIMLTARDSERDLVNGLEVGADDYVTKPFSAAELLSRIAALLRRRELDRDANARTKLTASGVVIDLVSDKVTVDDRPVMLTPSEFKILCLLAAAPGTTLSRREIMAHLWGSSHVGDEHTCEVHVSALRRKIERDPATPTRLLTVRGEGYVLAQE
jgi:two-component system response regulator RegX3